MTKEPDIEIYYAEICGLCHKALDFFRSRGLSFQAREVFWKDDAFVDTDVAREMFRRCGGTVDFVPQIFINGHHVAGWRKLEPMIASGEFDRLLTGPS
jgi:glutaredoxin